MMPHAHGPNQPDENRSEITPTELFVAFSHARRQKTVAYLSQKAAAISLGDLAEYIAIKEENPSYEWYERILTDLAHHHLPLLQEMNLVDYDRESESVQLAVERSVVTPYLDLAGYTGV